MNARLHECIDADLAYLAAKLEKHNKVENTRALASRAAYELALSQGYEGRRGLKEGRVVGGVSSPRIWRCWADASQGGAYGE